MPAICKTKSDYDSLNYTIKEMDNGTVSLFDNTGQPVNEHETKPCCELLGYTFDIENQKCRWAANTNVNELFKVVLNPDGNSSTLFEVEENETCSLEVSFDYLFLFKCDDLITAKAIRNGVTATAGSTLIDNQIKIDNLEAEISTLTNQRDFYQDLVDNHNSPPLVVECMGLTLNNYCLTTQGEIAWNSILDDKDVANVANGTIPSLPSPSSYIKWSGSRGTDTSMYGCDDVNNLISLNDIELASGNPPLIEPTCNYTIFDKKKSDDDLVTNQTAKSDAQAKLDDKINELDLFLTSIGADSSSNSTPVECGEYIDMFENFDTSFTVEVLGPSGTALTTVYEEDLITIGAGNLYSYIDSSSGKTGILISGDTALMPTLEETELFDLSADLCSQIRDTLVTDIFDQYLENNPFPSTEEEKTKIFKKLTEWYQSSWLEYKTVITDESVISLLENEKINISVSINDTCVNFSILLDRIKMNKVCTKVDNVKEFISEPPKFELSRIPDNQKSWLANTTRDYRYSNLKYRGTEYNTNHHKLVVNTKEVDLTLSPARAVEQDVWCYVSDNNCILEGCVSSGETYSAFTCPSGYTLDTDGNSCTKLTTTGVTTSATTYTIGAGVGLTKPVHSLSRGTIFIEDITDKTWPIYWTGTTKDSWVGPYYNSDYLVDSSGNYLNHTGFGSNTFTDGSLDYVSPNAFSGIKSEYGKSNSSIYSGKLNPNILWGGTDGSVSGTPYVNISNTDNAGRLLNASIWSTGLTPSNEWIGVSYCFELTETKVYRLGFAGDDDVRVKVNGKYIFNSTTTPSHDINIHKNFSASYSRTAQSYLVVGVSLPAGKNIIEVEGYNTILGVSGFVLEVYDATEAQLMNMRYETELNSVRVFSTADRIGQTFDLGEESANSCPTGYAYDNCNSASTSCVLIERTFRETEQLDEYCPCPTYPLIAKDYSGTTIELPLTASTTTFSCSGLTTFVDNYSGTTTIQDVEIIKGGSAYALGQRTATTFDGFWITEENDGTVGLYDVSYTAGTSHNYENVSNQVDSDCCKVIDDAFTTYANMFEQGVDTYPSISWDNNKKKCVYRKCGDNGCIDLDDVLTTELSAIDTVKEFASTLSSELIDVKNRKTLSGYPTLKMLYDRYNTRSEEFCGNSSSKYDYFDMDKFGQTVGNYWIDLIEQVVPATTIWGSTYTYKNTVFDQQKFDYRNSNTYFCLDTPNPPEPAFVLAKNETTSCSCPTTPLDYAPTPALEKCQFTETASVSGSAVGPVIRGSQNGAYGSSGTYFFNDISNEPFPIVPLDGTTSNKKLKNGAGVELPHAIHVNSGTLWDSDGSSSQGRLNNVGIWGNIGTPPAPVGTGIWIGVVDCIDIPVSKTYCIGIAADDRMRFFINGEKIFEWNVNSNTSTHKYWRVFEIKLDSGLNSIRMEGYNESNVKSFGVEIYESDITTLSNMTTEPELAAVTVFSSLDLFNNGDDILLSDATGVGYSCPAGYVLTNCNSGTLECTKFNEVPIVCNTNNGFALPVTNDTTNIEPFYYDGDPVVDGIASTSAIVTPVEVPPSSIYIALASATSNQPFSSTGQVTGGLRELEYYDGTKVTLNQAPGRTLTQLADEISADFLLKNPSGDVELVLTPKPKITSDGLGNLTLDLDFEITYNVVAPGGDSTLVSASNLIKSIYFKNGTIISTNPTELAKNFNVRYEFPNSASGGSNWVVNEAIAGGPPFSGLAKDYTTNVITQELPKPIEPNPDGTINLSTIQPSINTCNGVYILDRNCDSQFLGTVKQMDNLGNITTI